MQIKSKIGSAILGTLAFAVGGATIAMGSLKLNTHLLNKIKTKSVELSEETLKETVQRILSDETRCNENLNPNQNPDLDPDNITKLKRKDNGGTIIEVGNFKGEDINIVGIKLKDDQNDPNKKIFYLYYTKPTLGEQQKRTDDPCTNTNVKGCYYLSCEIIDSSNGCQVLLNGCSFPDDNSQSNTPTPCGPDNLLSGTNSGSCVPLQSEVFKNINAGIVQNDFYGFTGFEGITIQNTDVIKIQAKRVKMSTVCPPGQYPVRQNGDFVCQIMCTGGSTLNTQTNLCECPSNKPKYNAGKCESCPSGRRWNNTDCVCLNDKIEFNDQCVSCPEGSIKNTSNSCTCPNLSRWDSSTNKCKCEHNGYEKYYYQLEGSWNCHFCREGTYFWSGLCKTCPPGQSWVNSSCTCPGELQYDVYSSTCKCPDGIFIIKHNNNCYRCPAGSRPTNSNTACRCQGDGTTWNPETNKCCPNGQYYYPKGIDQTWKCNRCPSNKRHYYNGNCHRCQEGSHIYAGSCIFCPSGSTWSNNKCNCTGGRDWIYEEFRKNECKCPAGQFYYNQRCNTCLVGQNIYQNKCVTCPSGSTWGNNRCNCSGGRNWDYVHNSRNRCICPSGQHFYNGNCITCPSGSTWSNNQCNCLGGQEWNSSNNKCECPSDKPNLINGVCKRCGGDATWKKLYTSGPKQCVCPKIPPNTKRQYYYDNTCNKCSRGKVAFRGRHYAPGRYTCCPPGPHIQQGRCCPRGENLYLDGNCHGPCNRGSQWHRDSWGNCCRAGHFCDGEY